MKNEKEIILEPIFASKEQKAKGLSDESWLILTASTEEKPKVFYFNPSVDPTEYENFKHFVESNMEDFSSPGGKESTTKVIKDDYATICGYSGSMEDDCDEESRKSFKVAVGKGAIMEFHKGGVNEEKLIELVKAIKKDLENLESEGAYQAKDNADFQADPYKYHGVRKSDFF